METFHDFNINKIYRYQVKLAAPVLINHGYINLNSCQGKKEGLLQAKQTCKDSDLKRFKILKQKMQQQFKQVYNEYIDIIINPDNNNNSNCLWSFLKSKSVIKWV